MIGKYLSNNLWGFCVSAVSDTRKGNEMNKSGLDYEKIVQNVLAEEFQVVTPKFMAEVNLDDEWIVVSSEEFRSWTGLRRISGVEVHGPIYIYNSPEGAAPYTGRRLCNCSLCQANVDPIHKPN